MEAATEVVVSQKTQLVRHRHALRALSLALIAHAAVKGTVLLTSHIQEFLVGRRVLSRHGPDIHLELMDALVVRNRRADPGIP